MGFREVHRVEITELLRRWQAGESRRAIARAMGLARGTVNKYVAAAQDLGLRVSGPPASEEQLLRLLVLGDTAARVSSADAKSLALERFKDQIAYWLQNEHLQLTRIQELLAKDCPVSYSSLRRFVAKHGLGRRSRTTVRMSGTSPGELAECDFGRLGYLVDPKTGGKRLVWALVVVLVYSRHMFVWPLLGQRLEDVVQGLEAAWRFFGGVPRRLVLDNFPAAVAQPDALSPVLTRGFVEYAQFRGFLPDCARVRHPKDKPHVERAVPYVRERFFKGGVFEGLQDIREQAERWCLEVAGKRVHGSTRKVPLSVFVEQERNHLTPLVDRPFELPIWAKVKVHPDHHVCFGQALYSVPSSLCPPGSLLEVRATSTVVRLYHRGVLVKTHLRAPRGGRCTDPEDYPKEKTAYAMRAPERIVAQACKLGQNVGEFARRLLDCPLPWARIRAAQKLLRLAERYTPERLEAACARALAFDLIDVRRVERILLQALEEQAQEQPSPSSPLPARFARPGSAFAHHPQEVRSHAHQS